MLTLCLRSFQVAERALFLWNNEQIVPLLGKDNCSEVLPMVLPALLENTRNTTSHWNSTVHGLTCNVVKLFMIWDEKEFDNVAGIYRGDEVKRLAAQKEDEQHTKQMLALLADLTDQELPPSSICHSTPPDPPPDSPRDAKKPTKRGSGLLGFGRRR